MNEFISRSNIYFMYNKNKIDNIKLLLLEHTNVILFPTNEIMGQLEDFIDNPDIVFAPIDILLYHLKELEYLHKDYNEIEKFQRKAHIIEPNYYKHPKYAFTIKDLEEMEYIINNSCKEMILCLVDLYKPYFLRRKKDPILRILNI
jgi:hypothetical protein